MSLRHLSALALPLVTAWLAVLGSPAPAAAGAYEDWRDGVAAHRARDFARAIGLYTRAIEAKKYSGADLAKLYHMRGKARVESHGLRLRPDTDLLDSAVADLARSLELDPKSADALLDRGAAYAQLEQHDKAVADFTASLALKDAFMPYNNRCLSYEKLGRRAEAIEDCRRAAALDPSHWQPTRTLERLSATAERQGATTVAAAGDDATEFRVGLAAYAGGDYATAMKVLRPLAERGHASASALLAVMMFEGNGMPRDPVGAVRFARAAAGQGEKLGQYLLGRSYARGLGVVADPVQALEWFRKSANQGFPDSQFEVGDAYMLGRGVAKDPAEAARWFRLAAAQGQTSSEYALGYLLINGLGVGKDEAEAARWLQKAADKGHPRAQADVGALYYGGTGGMPKDLAKAAAWFGKAAEQNNADAQYWLGMMYARGEGVAQNDAQALEWFKRAGANGHRQAQEASLGLQMRMLTPLLVAAAQEGDIAGVRAALAKGGGTEAREAFGRTALISAAAEGHVEVVRLLLDAGAAVNAVDALGETALHGATEEGHLPVVQLLLARGADVGVKNTKGVTALATARRLKHAAIEAALVKAGARE